MSNQVELAAELRTVSGKSRLKELRRHGNIPATMYGPGHPSIMLQVKSTALEKLLGHGGKAVMLSLKVGDEPGVQALIQQLQHDPLSGAITHVDFYRLTATAKLKTHVPIHFINEPTAAGMGDMMVLRSLTEVLVECLPADLPGEIDVDLSLLNEPKAVIRVGDLPVGPGVTILTDPSEVVAGLHQRAVEVEEEAEEKAEAEAEAPAPATPAE